MNTANKGERDVEDDLQVSLQMEEMNHQMIWEILKESPVGVKGPLCIQFGHVKLAVTLGYSRGGCKKVGYGDQRTDLDWS